MTRRWAAVTVVATGLAGVATLHAAGVVAVSQQRRAFSVSQVSLHRGDSIQFLNEDVFNHQVFVKSPGFTFESPEQAPGDSLVVTFPKAGMFDVQCEIHPRMHLGVTVDEGAAR